MVSKVALGASTTFDEVLKARLLFVGNTIFASKMTFNFMHKTVLTWCCI